MKQGGLLTTCVNTTMVGSVGGGGLTISVLILQKLSAVQTETSHKSGNKG